VNGKAKTPAEIEAQATADIHKLLGGVHISRDDLVALVLPMLRGRFKREAQEFIFVGDGLYICPSKAELDVLLKDSLKGVPAYLTSTMDCDDYAWRLKVSANEKARSVGKSGPYALGVIWRTDSTRARQGHAYNWAVLDDRTLVMIEPQDGTQREFDETDAKVDLVCC
jgi:Agglutinin C-terminal